jgi:hypothetical protein
MRNEIEQAAFRFMETTVDLIPQVPAAVGRLLYGQHIHPDRDIQMFFGVSERCG